MRTTILGNENKERRIKNQPFFTIKSKNAFFTPSVQARKGKKKHSSPKNPLSKAIDRSKKDIVNGNSPAIDGAEVIYRLLNSLPAKYQCGVSGVTYKEQEKYISINNNGNSFTLVFGKKFIQNINNGNFAREKRDLKRLISSNVNLRNAASIPSLTTLIKSLRLEYEGLSSKQGDRYEKPERVLFARQLLEHTTELETKINACPHVFKKQNKYLKEVLSPDKKKWQQSIHQAIASASSWEKKDIHKAYLGVNKKGPRAGESRAEIEHYRASIKKEKDFLKSASERTGGRGKVNTFSMTPEDLYYIINDGLKERVEQNKAEHKIKAYLKHLETAFRIGKIDTIHAQAVYLAHSGGEMGFMFFTEGQKKTNGFADMPEDVRIQDDTKGPIGYQTGGQWKDSKFSVDPLVIIPRCAQKNKDPKDFSACFRHTFIGRGPVQVTHRHGYAAALVYMEELAKNAADKKDANLLWEAVSAIKKDPSMAAHPRYTFLFSAAFMHISGLKNADSFQDRVVEGDHKDAGFNGLDAYSNWVAGGDFNVFDNKSTGHADRAQVKQKVYNRAVERLTKINEKAK